MSKIKIVGSVAWSLSRKEAGVILWALNAMLRLENRPDVQTASLIEDLVEVLNCALERIDIVNMGV